MNINYVGTIPKRITYLNSNVLCTKKSYIVIGPTSTNVTNLLYSASSTGVMKV